MATAMMPANRYSAGTKSSRTSKSSALRMPLGLDRSIVLATPVEP